MTDCEVVSHMASNASDERDQRYDDLTTKLIVARLGWIPLVCMCVLLADAVCEFFDPNLSPVQIALTACIHLAAIGALLAIRQISLKATTLGAARLLGYVFVVLFYVTVLALQFVSNEEYHLGASLYMAIMLIGSFLFPWGAGDAVCIAVMGMIAYTLETLRIQGMSEPLSYATNLSFLVIGAVVAAVVKRDDERRRLHEFLLQTEIEERNAQMERDLELARRVHLSVIPKSTVMEEAEVAVTYAPMSYVGGDYANFLHADDGRLVFFVSDVSGHGVSAALVANRIHTEVERLMKEPIGPGDLLHRLDLLATEQLRNTTFFLSAVSGVVDFRQKKLIYSNHGHPPQILYHKRNSQLDLLEPRSPILGLGIPGPSPPESEADLPLNSGDRILLFTDGVTETHGKSGELYGLERLKEFAERNASLPPTEFNAALTAELDAFREGPIEDDVFLLTIRMK